MSVPPDPAYRQELREVLGKKPRVILNANDWYAARVEKGLPRPERAAFQLATSHRCQREFVCLWELFGEPEFKKCVEVLTSTADFIRQKTPFTTIVTATAIAKHLVELIHALVETEREPVRVEALPRFPFLASDRRAPLDFRNEQVLILADVVASGTLVRHLADVVKELGGTVVAILTVVLVGEEMIAHLAAPDYTALLQIGNDAAPIRVYSLTDLAIPNLKSHEFDPGLLIRIEAYTVYPEQPPKIRDGTLRWLENSGSFTLAETYEHLDGSGAIDFDFFAMDESCFTTAVRLDKLFEAFGEAIWERIKRSVRLEDAAAGVQPGRQGGKVFPTIVTTFRVGDRCFKDFVEARCEREGYPVRTLFMHRREPVDHSDGVFFVSPRGTGLTDPTDELSGRHVVLLLSSVQSSHMLRDLASHVAAAGARRITVVCLTNRMGLRTRYFIEQIQRLLGGLNPAVDNHANFKFVSIYNLFDLESDDIAKMQDGSAAMFDHYQKQTAVPSFRRWVDQVRKYFGTRSVTNRDFLERVPDRLPEAFELALPSGQRCSVQTTAGKLSLLSAMRVLYHRYNLLIEELCVLDKKQGLYKLYAILLLDLSHLRLIGKAGRIRHLLKRRIGELREKRFGWELEGARAADDGGETLADRIALRVDLETHLLFGLALFSYLDHEVEDHAGLAFETLSGGRTSEQWQNVPINLLAYYGDERVVWMVSMLLHLSQPRFREAEVQPEFKKRLTHFVREQMESFKQWDEELASRAKLTAEEAELRTRIRRCRDNLDLLLVDLRVHDDSQPGTIIRFLHSHLLRLPQRHSPIDTNLNRAILLLGRAIDDAWLPASGPIPQRRRVKVGSVEVQQALEDAIYTAGLLEQIARAARELFQFTPCRPEEAARFLSQDGSDSLAQDVNELGNVLQDIRINNLASRADLMQLTEVRGRIQRDLWDPDLPLQKALHRYIVPLRRTFCESMRAAQNSFVERNRG